MREPMSATEPQIMAEEPPAPLTVKATAETQTLAKEKPSKPPSPEHLSRQESSRRPSGSQHRSLSLPFPRAQHRDRQRIVAEAWEIVEESIQLRPSRCRTLKVSREWLLTPSTRLTLQTL